MQSTRSKNSFWKTLPAALAAPALLCLFSGQALSDNLTSSHAGGSHNGCCDHCGSCVCCEKVCVLHCEKKEVKVTCWGCKCEEICIPGKGRRDCKHCETVCDDCSCGDGCCEKCACSEKEHVHSKPKSFVWWSYCAGCPKKIRTRKVLMKKTIKKKVPVYKWVVKEVCRECVPHCQGAEIVPGAKIPPPPPGYNTIIPGRPAVDAPSSQVKTAAAQQGLVDIEATPLRR